MSLSSLLLLYLAFRVKQVTCDFFLQPSWMALVKGHPLKQGGTRALFMHTAIHSAFTCIIMIVFAPHFLWLALVDFIVHGLIDKVKTLINYKMGWTYKDNAYWWAFGIDQEAHNLTHLAYIVLIAMSVGISLH